MVDLKGQYQHIKKDVDNAIHEVLDTAHFIKGPVVKAFEEELAAYLNVKHVIGCANGTDALQIALMALDLEPGDEVIVPAFTYVATAEVIALLGLTPVMVDVDPETFNLRLQDFEAKVSAKTKVIVPVHLFGQSSEMDDILNYAKEQNIYIIEDNAQAIGADYTHKNGTKSKTGTMGDIGCTSFFPSKNLGCYGDGGAIFTNDDKLAEKIRQISNHGQSVRYYHDVVGVNSRLDAIQAAILRVKLKQLDNYGNARRKAADYYDQAFSDFKHVVTPVRNVNSTHVFHQYTLKVDPSIRTALREHLKEKGISHNVYYPVPLYDQKAFSHYTNKRLETTDQLCASVLSLPMHTELTEETLSLIVEGVKSFFK